MRELGLGVVGEVRGVEFFRFLGFDGSADPHVPTDKMLV